MLCGDMDKAVEQWQAVLEISPDDYTTLLYLGNYYADTGDMDKARQYLSKAYGLRPTPYVKERLE